MSCNTCNTKHKDYYSENIYTWCTNCGNYGIHESMKRALVAEDIPPHKVLMCFDIGCHGNGADKIDGYRFHGLHGRVIPFATGAHIANPTIPVIAFGGDGATLGEGINHLIHAIRSNYNITFVMHNNSNYGLTKGQASPSTPQDVPMSANPDGIVEDTLHAIGLVLSLDPSFVARTFSGNFHQMEAIFKEAINHKGFSFIEILQACPTYNKATPHDWYMKRVYDTIEREGFDNTDIHQAREVARDLQKHIATGIIYKNPSKLDYYSRLPQRKGVETTLVEEVKEY